MKKGTNFDLQFSTVHSILQPSIFFHLQSSIFFNLQPAIFILQLGVSTLQPATWESHSAICNNHHNPSIRSTTTTTTTRTHQNRRREKKKDISYQKPKSIRSRSTLEQQQKRIEEETQREKNKE